MEQSQKNINRVSPRKLKYFGDPSAAKVGHFILVAINSRCLLSRRSPSVYRKNPHKDQFAQMTWFSFRIYLEKMAFFKLSFLLSFTKHLDSIKETAPMWSANTEKKREDKTPSLLDYGASICTFKPVIKLYA